MYFPDIRRYRTTGDATRSPPIHPYPSASGRPAARNARRDQRPRPFRRRLVIRCEPRDSVRSHRLAGPNGHSRLWELDCVKFPSDTRSESTSLPDASRVASHQDSKPATKVRVPVSGQDQIDARAREDTLGRQCPCRGAVSQAGTGGAAITAAALRVSRLVCPQPLRVCRPPPRPESAPDPPAPLPRPAPTRRRSCEGCMHHPA